MGQSVLCAVDESTEPAVCEVAADLAGRLGLPLVLAHIAEDPPAGRFTSRAERERARHRASRNGAEILRQAAGSAVGVEPHHRVELGWAALTLLELADEEDAELLVVGSRGRGSFASALLGSFSRAMTRRAPCPVVVVPQGAIASDGHAALAAEQGGIVLCGIPASERSGRLARFAADLSRRLGDRLVLVLESEPASIPEVLAELPLDASVVEYEGSLAPGLEAVAEAEEDRLIAISGSARGPWRSLFDGSPEAGLLRHARTPVIVLPEGAEIAPGSDHYEVGRAA